MRLAARIRAVQEKERAANDERRDETPMMKPICCRRGVAPTMYPVFRSCDVAPAFAAAMHTSAPTQRATGWNTSPVRPMRTKTTHVPMSVAIVMPEIGFEDVPMIPTIRDETVTKKNPKTTIRADMRSDPGNGPCGKPGRTAMMSARTAEPTSTKPIGRSSSVRIFFAAPAPPPNDFRDSRKAPTMVGIVLTSVMTPAHATAPAPM